MFSDYRHPIPKSRLKTIKIKAENGRFQRVPGPTHEEFSPSNRDHVLGALTQRGILVENTQEATLKKLDAPECRLLLKYTAVNCSKCRGTGAPDFGWSRQSFGSKGIFRKSRWSSSRLSPGTEI